MDKGIFKKIVITSIIIIVVIVVFKVIQNPKTRHEDNLNSNGESNEETVLLRAIENINEKVLGYEENLMDSKMSKNERNLLLEYKEKIANSEKEPEKQKKIIEERNKIYNEYMQKYLTKEEINIIKNNKEKLNKIYELYDEYSALFLQKGEEEQDSIKKQIKEGKNNVNEQIEEEKEKEKNSIKEKIMEEINHIYILE